MKILFHGSVYCRLFYRDSPNSRLLGLWLVFERPGDVFGYISRNNITDMLFNIEVKTTYYSTW